MNKWLLVTLLSLFVINLTFKSTNAVTIGGRSIFNSHNDGIKRYVLRTKHYNHRLYIDFILYICSSVLVLHYNELNVIVLLAMVKIGVEIK
jgi:hypothetical protein